MNVKRMLMILVGIMVVLMLLVFLRQSKETERPSIIEQAKFERLVPENLSLSSIVKLELYAGAKPEEKVVITKDGDKWRVSSHFNSPAKKETVEEYIDKIVKLKGEMRAEVPSDDALADYNLKDDQAFHVDVYTSTTGEATLKLLVGKSPNYQLTFVRKAGERKIYDGGVNFRQEAGIYGDELDKTPTADRWLDKDIMKIDKEKITRLAYEMPDKKLLFEKKEKEVPQEQPQGNTNEGNKEGSTEGEQQPKKKEYEWVLAQGGTGEKFKETGLQNLLGRFSNLIASSIVDPAKKADWGLEPPAFKLTISREGDTDVVLEAGRPNPAQNGYLRVATNQEDIVYEVSKYTFEQIFPKGQDLFDLPSLNLDKEKIEMITIEQPEGKVIVKKEGSDWKVTEPAVDLNIQVSTLNTLASALASWKSADYADNDADVGEFNKTVTFKMGDEMHILKMAGNAKTIDGVYVMLDDKPLRLVTNRVDANKILLKPRDVYELKVLDFSPDKVTSIEIKENNTTQTIKKGEGGDWVLVADGKETKLVNENVTNFMNNISGLQALDICPGLAWNSFTPQLNMRLNITDSEPLDFSAGQGPNETIVATVPRHKAVVQLAKERWEEIKNGITKAREPKPEEPPPTPPQEQTQQPAEQPSQPTEQSQQTGGEPAKPEQPTSTSNTPQVIITPQPSETQTPAQEKQ